MIGPAAEVSKGPVRVRHWGASDYRPHIEPDPV
jgi:hypothetical protein